MTSEVKADEQEMVEVPMPHMYGEEPAKTIMVTKQDRDEFKVRPKYLVGNEGGDDIIYLDAENPAYYGRACPKSTGMIWCLVKKDTYSSYSKRRFYEEARRKGMMFKTMSPAKFQLVIQAGGGKGFEYEGKDMPLPDVVVVRLGATIDYFGLAVLRQLEAMGVRVVNGVNSMEIARDKMYTHQIMAENGVDIPKSLLMALPLDLNMVKEQLGFPFVLKALSGSKGDAVWLLETREQAESQLPEIQESVEVGYVVCQEFVEASKGRDIRAVVVGDKVIGSMMRVSPNGFKSNVHQGGAAVKVKLVKPALMEMAVKAAKLAGLEVAGIDLLLSADGYKLCEVNSSPGFEGLERGSQLNIATKILDFIGTLVATERAKVKQQKKSFKKVSLQPDHRAKRPSRKRRSMAAVSTPKREKTVATITGADAAAHVAAAVAKAADEAKAADGKTTADAAKTGAV